MKLEIENRESGMGKRQHVAIAQRICAFVLPIPDSRLPVPGAFGESA
jgi:hypothetical protein